MEIIFDEYDMRKLPPRERLDKITQILKNERDESIRWDSVWLAAEITEVIDKDDPIFAEIADLMVWVLLNDDNGIVKHEAAFQIGLRNMKSKIPDLINSTLNDKKELVRHEAIEALGLMRAHDFSFCITKKFCLYNMKLLKKWNIHSITNLLPSTILDKDNPSNTVKKIFTMLSSIEEKMPNLIPGCSTVYLLKKIR